MWVKVRKGGVINWFANGEKGTTFYTSSKNAVVPAKTWTHVVGTYDATEGKVYGIHTFHLSMSVE